MDKLKMGRCQVCGQLIGDPLLREIKYCGGIYNLSHDIINAVLNGLDKEIDVEKFDKIKANVLEILMPKEV